MCNHIPFFRLFGRFYVLEKIFTNLSYPAPNIISNIITETFVLMFNLKLTDVKFENDVTNGTFVDCFKIIIYLTDSDLSCHINIDTLLVTFISFNIKLF